MAGSSGCLSEADVVRGRISPDPRHRAWQGTEDGSTASATVGEVMSRSPVSVNPQTDAADLAATRDDSLIAADIRRRLVRYGGLDRWTVHVHQGSVTITDDYADPTGPSRRLGAGPSCARRGPRRGNREDPGAGAGDSS